MSTWLYCDDPVPHDMHEWSVEVYSGRGTMRTSFDYHTCPGVKSDAALLIALGTVELLRSDLDEAEAAAGRAAKRNRREIWEAMNEDADDPDRTPSTLHLDQP